MASCFPEHMDNLPAELILVASPVPRDLELHSHVENDDAAGSGIHRRDGIGSLKCRDSGRAASCQPVERGQLVCNDLPRDTCGSTMRVWYTFSTGATWAFFESRGARRCVRAAWARVSRNVDETPRYRSHPWPSRPSRRECVARWRLMNLCRLHVRCLRPAGTNPTYLLNKLQRNYAILRTAVWNCAIGIVVRTVGDFYSQNIIMLKLR